ncbi:MAG: hypothetical protein IEMM0006_1152 [bacterium]|nr:MAG: hypothetical protein IEMM0006_1152 [bacterium]
MKAKYYFEVPGEKYLRLQRMKKYCHFVIFRKIFILYCTLNG